MHEYLRAVGFSRIESKEQLNQLLNMTEESYQTERTAVSANGNDFSERKKEFAPRMGIMLRGEYDEKGDYQRDYYFPYFMGTQEKFYDNISIERHAEKESYAGVCEDLSMGVTIIFYLQNIVDYLSEQRMNRNLLPPGTATIRFSGLSIDGRILLREYHPEGDRVVFRPVLAGGGRELYWSRAEEPGLIRWIHPVHEIVLKMHR